MASAPGTDAGAFILLISFPTFGQLPSGAPGRAVFSSGLQTQVVALTNWCQARVGSQGVGGGALTMAKQRPGSVGRGGRGAGEPASTMRVPVSLSASLPFAQ